MSEICVQFLTVHLLFKLGQIALKKLDNGFLVDKVALLLVHQSLHLLLLRFHQLFYLRMPFLLSESEAANHFK